MIIINNKKKFMTVENITNNMVQKQENKKNEKMKNGEQAIINVLERFKQNI
jgi:hypothetical protein